MPEVSSNKAPEWKADAAEQFRAASLLYSKNHANGHMTVLSKIQQINQ